MTYQRKAFIRVGGQLIDIAHINLTYDAAFTVAINHDHRIIKIIVSTILNRNDFEVTHVRTHAESESFRGRSIGFDCLLEFDDGTLCNVEMQKVMGRMPLKRMLFHRAKLQAGYSLKKGERDFNKMKPTIVIILLEGDFFERGEPLYRISYHDAFSKEDLEPGQGIYIADITAKDTSTELGRLMEDINQVNPNLVHNPVFHDALEMLKSDRGVNLMNDFIEILSEEEAKASEEQGRRKELLSLYRDGVISKEEAAKRLNISVNEFLSLVEE